MSKPKDLLKKQELSLDNHHPNTPLEWDDELHFHKKITVCCEGEKTSVSGSFHLKKDRGVGITFDMGKSHHKIKNEKVREQLKKSLKKEIQDAMKDSQEARAFIKSVTSMVESLSSGQNGREIIKRKRQAYDNVMSALGIPVAKSVSLANSNEDLLSFYMDGPDSYFDIDNLLYAIRLYQKHYHLHIDELNQINPIYYIIYENGKLSLGELSPYAIVKYRHKGFRMSKKGVMEAIAGNYDGYRIK